MRTKPGGSVGEVRHRINRTCALRRSVARDPIVMSLLSEDADIDTACNRPIASGGCQFGRVRRSPPPDKSGACLLFDACAVWRYCAYLYFLNALIPDGDMDLPTDPHGASISAQGAKFPARWDITCVLGKRHARQRGGDIQTPKAV